MKRRSLLLAAGTFIAGSGAVIGSGAFSSLEADRSVSVQTAGDASALLSLTGDDVYVSDDSGSGALTIDLGNGDGAEGSGFNVAATTNVDGIVTVTNRGTQTVEVNFGEDGVEGSSTGLRMTSTVDGAQYPVDLTFDLPGTDSARRIGPGESVSIDAVIDVGTSGNTVGYNDTSVTIHATQIQ